MLKNIKIVLIGTTHPGNIGATARAMKNMGLDQLVLVNPKHFPNIEASARASGADDVLDNATIVQTLADAVADCSLVIGTSSRPRSLALPPLSAREAADKMLLEAKQHPVAIVFGTERTGLTNEELAVCHYHVCIASNPEYASLNIASAVQIICYEIYANFLLQEGKADTEVTEDELASAAELDSFYQHLEEFMVQTEFLDPAQPKKLLLRLKRLYARARPEAREINILRGIMTAAQKKLG